MMRENVLDTGLASRNIDLAFELVRQALAQPEAMGEIEALGRDGTLVFVDPDDASLTDANLAMAARVEETGEPVVRAELQRRVFLQAVDR